MLSDRYRAPKIVAGVLLLVGLGALYARTATSFRGGLFECRKSPSDCDGAPQILALYRIDAMLEDGFTVSKVVQDVRVVADPVDLGVGDTVSVAGRFRASDGAVVAESVGRHRLRRHKKALGILALLLAVVWGSRVFGWRDGRVVLRG